MSETINFGIDLGTTNSSIAKFENGSIEVLKNPQSWKDTTPSIISFRKGSIHVGDKAKEYAQKDSKNVFSRFKRKMGTDEEYVIESLGKRITPVELSAEVLKYIKSFINDENFNATVITIPASFDTVQSNTTKEAGNLAGFSQIELLQEPIAASLAYVNNQKNINIGDGYWLVYDLGGGTFDVALMRIIDSEMKVIDHVGDNFLGGTDFDRLLVEQIILPFIKTKGKFSNLLADMQSYTGKYNAEYIKFLYKAESAKIDLSSFNESEIDLEIVDENGKEIDEVLIVKREQFEKIIQSSIQKTISLIQEMLDKNGLTNSAIDRIIMVGGSTYIPYVRTEVADRLNIDVECGIDPTTAVAIGAAYYAGTKLRNKKEVKGKEISLSVKMAYSKTSKDEEEYLGIKVNGGFENFNYRITRKDGGFDTGLRPLTEKIGIELPLVAGAYNFFEFQVYDSSGNIIVTNADMIGISQGQFGISGQPLPEDICYEVDNIYDDSTKLKKIFSKNDTLPLEETVIVTVNKNVLKESKSDNSYRINVYEGPEDSPPEANKLIGELLILGKDLNCDIYSGTDLELKFFMNESRDLTISAYLSTADQEFNKVFTSQQRRTNIDKLKSDLEGLSSKLEAELSGLEEKKDENSQLKIQNLKSQVQNLQFQLLPLTEDDQTDKKYQIEDEKRRVARGFAEATKYKVLHNAKQKYFDVKNDVEKRIQEFGSDKEVDIFRSIINEEKYFIDSSNVQTIEDKTDVLREIYSSLIWRDKEFLLGGLKYCHENLSRMNNPEASRELIEKGVQAAEDENWDLLRDILAKLMSLLPNNVKETEREIGFYG